MARYYTQYWSKEWLRDERIIEDELLNHTAGNQFFKKWGVIPGDFIYIVTVNKGQLYLMGRMEVDKVCSQKEAEKLLGTSDLWEGKDHLIAKPDPEILRFDRQVPLDVTKRLRFLSPTGKIRSLVFTSPTELDRQTLRGVRKLTSESAAELDRLLAV
jgi:hypothetical protein